MRKKTFFELEEKIARDMQNPSGRSSVAFMPCFDDRCPPRYNAKCKYSHSKYHVDNPEEAEHRRRVDDEYEARQRLEYEAIPRRPYQYR